MEIKNNESIYHTDTDKSNFLKGFTWGITLSIPLWLSIFGWIKILKNLI